MSTVVESKFQREGDEIGESKSFSWLSLAGLFSSLVGLFSTYYVQILPFAVLGTAIGALTLLLASRWDLNWFSRLIGSLAVIVGTIAGASGFFDRMLETSGDEQQARVVSELYLKSLSSNDWEKVHYLVGYKAQGPGPGPGDESEERENPEVTISKLKKGVETDPVHVEIAKRGPEAKWEYAGLDGEYSGLMGYTYRLRFRDIGQTIPSEYIVYARKDCEKFETKETVHWFVDSLDRKRK